jgi:hypothetical protein
MSSELVKLSPTEKDVTDEAAVRIASQVYVWDGTKGLFLETDQFVAFKKQFDCLQQNVEGVELAALKEMVKEPDWPEIYKHRAKDSKPIREYFEKVVRFRRIENSVYKAYLLNYWEKGQFVAVLLRDPNQYGNKTVKNFAADLGVSESSVYQYLHCSEKWSQERALEMAEHKMTWRGATKILSVKDDAERAKIETAFLAGKIDADQVNVAVKKANRADATKKEASGEKVDRRGGFQLKSVFDGAYALSEKMQERLSDFVEGYKVYQKLPPEKKVQQKAKKAEDTELTKSMKAASGSLLRLQRRLTKVVVEPESKGIKPVAEAKANTK